MMTLVPSMSRVKIKVWCAVSLVPEPRNLHLSIPSVAPSSPMREWVPRLPLTVRQPPAYSDLDSLVLGAAIPLAGGLPTVISGVALLGLEDLILTAPQGVLVLPLLVLLLPLSRTSLTA